MLKFISTAKKVLAYLMSGQATGSYYTQYIPKLEHWLSILYRQLSATAPLAPACVLPPTSSVRTWSEDLTSCALAAIGHDMHSYGCLTKKVAQQVMGAWFGSLG